jgi:hypothetical protein
MLDLESDDQRSPQADLPEPTPSHSLDLIKNLVIGQDSIEDDELQTVERVLPTVQTNQCDISPIPPISTPHYIQAVRGKTGVFLRTNLPHTETGRTTAAGIAWLIGRSRNCAIVFPEPAVSRCHAVIGYDAQQGFYLMDVGSSNGTFLNQQRLVTMQRYVLESGNIITISHISIEVFLFEQES